MAIIGKIFGTRDDRFLKSVRPVISKINSYEETYKSLSDEQLAGLTEAFKQRLADGETLDHLLPEAFAAVREGAKRALGLWAYDVQLIGGVVLHQGKISEMRTGEGKTLVATFPAYLNALTGKGVHVVTVNDYLAERDSHWMGKVYAQLGMSCKPIIGSLTPQERQENYQADIIYATNNELGFDYLRDNMAYSLDQRVQRELYMAIVDEVDSILIDEARTPLIISGPTEDKSELYTAINEIMPQFTPESDYEVDEKARTASLTDEGMDKAEKLLRTRGMLQENDSLYEMEHVMLVHHLNQALRAHALFQKDVDYIVKGGQVIIIDEFTGRMMPGRRFGEGLHQALEAKEEASIQNENQTLASVTFQNFFRMYEKLAGMTGTGTTEAEEFETIYSLQVVTVPTNLPVAREDETDLIYRTKAEKDKAIVADIRECYERGQPVLVGTTSIDKSEHYAELLKKHRIKHQVLNARHHEKEAEIIAQAGRLGAITIATNMAGRGTDIQLGGNLDMLLDSTDASEHARIKASHEKEKSEVLKLGGLRVLGTERHESRRIDNQLRGRSGRQGDPGSTVFYLSLQDDLMRIFAAGLDGMMERMDMPENQVIKSRLVTKAIETAQRKIETRNFDMRKALLKYDDVLNEQRKVIYEQRLEVLSSEQVDDIIRDFRAEGLESAFSLHFAGKDKSVWTVDGFHEDMIRLFNIDIPIQQWLSEDIAMDDIETRAKALVERAWTEKEERLGSPMLRHLEKAVLLQVLDMQWKDHLQRLDFLRQGVQLRAYAQKDPLNEFKREAFGMFEHMLNSIESESVTLLSRVEVQNQEQPQQEPEQAYADTPRNAPCPCGSGKKFKYCHGKVASNA